MSTTMPFRLMLRLCLLAFWVAGPIRDSAAVPNLLLVIADDVGTDSLALFNRDARASLPPTPNIDSLFQSGILFRNAYGYPTCSPTRATILTGRYGFRTGIGYALATPGDPVLSASELTLPEVLTAQAQLGYRHANIGKWHLSFGADDPNLIGGWQHFSGVLIGALPDYERWPKTIDGRTTPFHRTYATSDNVDDALEWIGQQGPAPWMLWLAFNAAHTPYHKPDNSLHSYDLLPSSSLAISTNPRPYFEAMIEALDTEFGRLLAGIDRSRTTIIFLGDNGSVGTVIQPPFPADRGKGTLYQGGVRVPLLVSGPAVVHPRREESRLVGTVDLFATLLELAGVDLRAALPAGHVMDSRSLVPILRDQAFQPEVDCILSENFSPTLSEHLAGRAAVDARYKLIRFESGASAFYDIGVDPVEETNLLSGSLSADQQAAAGRLGAKLDDWSSPPEAPAITGWMVSREGFSVRISSSGGAVYQLERAGNTAMTTWVETGSSVVATQAGSTVTLLDPNPWPKHGFYRVAARNASSTQVRSSLRTALRGGSP